MRIKTLLATLLLGIAALSAFPQKNIDSILPVRGFCINAPRPAGVDSFVTFIDKELSSRKVNTLFLLIDYRYQFTSHPELSDTDALSGADAKKIVQACQRHKIRIIPQINLLGHQSWASTPNKLMKAYPQFDETPWVKFPEKYEWPNADKLYCKSYCPLAPGLHDVLFAVIDELCDAFEADAFHAGMDEVFYIGEDQCPRCGGRDKAELFAGEVRALHDHIVQKGREMWIWGDRLLDGKTTGIGEWEASYNNTHRAIDMIPKDVVICDWHYERADKTAVLFAMKGFRVVTCPWRDPGVGITQVRDMVNFRQGSTPEMKQRFLGIVETTWSPTDRFLQGYYGVAQPATRPNGRPADPQRTPWNCFRAVFDEMGRQTGN
ncbi:MAG: glycoside hydrolase [Sphingobacteriales bacterium 50-39]|nr:family 20 glycosylhydrolase [Sphingobacteriales bacterium]OJW55676.1 MAG: glycoside hydrolase [Sphingobacteriales bacterium 50-39]